MENEREPRQRKVGDRGLLLQSAQEQGVLIPYQVCSEDAHFAWLAWMHDVLTPKPVSGTAPVALDLFAGCGGLSLGFEVCGFRTIGYEMNGVAVDTYRRNLAGDCHETFLQVGMPDVQEADVIIGGPPCQPFSQFGYQRGIYDARDGFPVFLDALRRIRPRIAIFENVRGLLYRNKGYLRRIAMAMQECGYAVDARVLKAVDYGVPQRRERVVVVATQVGWEWPERLVNEPVPAGVALGPMVVSEESPGKRLTPNMDRYIAKYEARSQCVNPRDLHLDKPSRTVTCRNLGGATADMLRVRLPSGDRRMLTIQEGARLQGFPDWFAFTGNEYEQYEQIGNAVPPLLGLALAGQAMAALERPTLSPRRVTVSDDILAQDRISERVDQTLNLLRQVGLPLRDLTSRRRTRLAKALLAVAGLTPDSPWHSATSYFNGTAEPVTTREIIKFWNAHYGENIADASYDDVRRKDLILLVESSLVASSAADPSADTNDGTRGYSMPLEALALLHSFESAEWEDELLRFRHGVGELKDRLSKSREFNMVPVTLPNGQRYQLSPGPHNEIQKAIIEEFLPRFSRGAQVLYIGDTAKKILHQETEALQYLGITELNRSTLPDVIAYEEERDWLFLVEAVHSSNPIDRLRHLALRRLTQHTTAKCLFVSAFSTAATFARFSKQISWETEVWIADQPDHLVHFDGDHYLTPYS